MIKLNLYLLHQREHIFQIHLQSPFILGILIFPFPPGQKNLGVTLSSNLSMEKHVTNICRSAYVEIRRISNIRHYLNIDATKTLVCAFVLSKLDYCNSLLSSCPSQLLNNLQKVQNSAARLIFKAHPFFKNSTGHQSTQESGTKSHPCATILSLKLSHSICLNFCLFTIHPDNFALS